MGTKTLLSQLKVSNVHVTFFSGFYILQVFMIELCVRIDLLKYMIGFEKRANFTPKVGSMSQDSCTNQLPLVTTSPVSVGFPLPTLNSRFCFFHTE